MVNDATKADPGRVRTSYNAGVRPDKYVVLCELAWVFVMQLEEPVEHVWCCRSLSGLPLLVAVNLSLGEDVCIVNLFGDKSQ